MKKCWIFSFVLLSFLLVLSACSRDDGEAKDNNEDTGEKVDTGMNEISLEEFVKKKENEKAFYVVVVDASEKELKQTKLIEAYDKAFKDKEISANYINIHDLNDEENEVIKTMDKMYSERKHGYEPFSYGGTIVVHNGLIDVASNYYGEVPALYPFKNMITNGKVFLDSDHYKKTVMADIQLSIDYVKDENIEILN